MVTVSCKWALESFISVSILLLNTFFSIVFCLVVSNNSWAGHFHQTFLNSFLRLFLFCFWQQFSVFLVLYLLILHLLYCIQPFICSCNTFVVPIDNCKTVSFDCLRIISRVFTTVYFILLVKIIC